MSSLGSDDLFETDSNPSPDFIAPNDILSDNAWVSDNLFFRLNLPSPSNPLGMRGVKKPFFSTLSFRQ